MTRTREVTSPVIVTESCIYTLYQCQLILPYSSCPPLVMSFEYVQSSLFKRYIKNEQERFDVYSLFVTIYLQIYGGNEIIEER
jgi:hypothetical protein